jgi:prolipoprotein diacylglyceryltransferase
MPLASMPALITFTFPATVTLAGLTVRWETLAGAAAVLLALLFGALAARGTPVDPSLPADWPSTDPEDGGPNHLRADDLLYIAIAALPGALVGGRLGYALIHLGYYQGSPDALLDISRGGLELSMGVVGGTITASVVAMLLGVPLGRWLHALALPLLTLLGLIKVAMLLGGSGQGLPTDFSLATRYLGEGPWGSLAPAIPSWPSQAMEATATLLAGAVAWWLMALGVFRKRNGAAFFLAVGLWAIARAVVAATWRDPAVAGSLSAAQLLAVGVAIGCALLVIAFALAETIRRTPPGEEPVEPGPAEAPSWPSR